MRPIYSKVDLASWPADTYISQNMTSNSKYRGLLVEPRCFSGISGDRREMGNNVTKLRSVLLLNYYFFMKSAGDKEVANELRCAIVTCRIIFRCTIEEIGK